MKKSNRKKFRKFHRKKPVFESLFNKVDEIFKNTYFAEHLRTTASSDKACSKIEKTWFLLVHWVTRKTVKQMKNSRSICPEAPCKEGVLENFAKFIGKQLRGSLFLTELQI